MQVVSCNEYLIKMQNGPFLNFPCVNKFVVFAKIKIKIPINKKEKREKRKKKMDNRTTEGRDAVGSAENRTASHSLLLVSSLLC